MYRKIFLATLLFAFVLLLVPPSVSGSIGVGVGSGKINVTQKLVPGGIYELPPISVLNTGDEPSEYGISIEYQETQVQAKPPQEWFTFSPTSFHLDPKKSQVVTIALTIPVKTVPGDYFAYVEAHPVKADVSGVTKINIAAAAKLYFTVSPANIFQGIYYRIGAFLQHNAPWTYITLALIALVVLILILRRFFSLNFGISMKKK